MKNIKTFLTTNKISFLQDENISKHTYYRIGGKVKYFTMPKNIDQCKILIKYCYSLKINFYILGSGANILFNDEGFDGIIINLEKYCDISMVESNKVVVDAGVKLQSFIDFTIKKNLIGYAELSGIPGTIGGNIKMNAGAFDKEISNYLESITILDKTGKLISKTKSEIGFGYRNSKISDNELILNATFVINKTSTDLTQIKDEILEKRKQKQPLEYPSCGSVFKKARLRPQKQTDKKIDINPFIKWNGIPAGVLIEAVGLKGFKYKGAMISTKHANFILNTNNAKAKDIVYIMNKIRSKVYTELGYILEPEVQLVGIKLDKI